MHEDVPSTENSTEGKEIANKPEMSYGREQKKTCLAKSSGLTERSRITVVKKTEVLRYLLH